MDTNYTEGDLGTAPEVQAVFDASVEALRAAGATVDRERLADPLEPVGGLSPFDAEFTVLLFEFKVQIAAYLATLRGTGLRTLADLIQFNLDHCPEEMKYFGQEIFEISESTSGDLEDPEYLAARELNRSFSRGVIDGVRARGYDTIITPSYSFGTTTAATAGYPSMSVPVGFTAAGRPVAFYLAAGFLEEPRLIAAGSAIEFFFRGAHATPAGRRRPARAARRRPVRAVSGTDPGPRRPRRGGPSLAVGAGPLTSARCPRTALGPGGPRHDGPGGAIYARHRMLLAEELALVAIDPDSGRHRTGTREQLDAYLAGLLLADLVLRGHAEVGARTGTLVLAGTSPEEPPLMAVTAEVVATKGPRIKAVLSAMSRALRQRTGSGTWDSATNGLVEHALIREVDGGVRTRYEVVDAAARDEIVARLPRCRRVGRADRAADGGPPVMTGPGQLLEIVALDRSSRRHAKRRIDHTLFDDSADLGQIGDLVRKVIAEAEAAVAAGAVARQQWSCPAAHARNPGRLPGARWDDRGHGDDPTSGHVHHGRQAVRRRPT